MAKQKRAAFGFSLSGGNRLVVACACARSQLQYKILRTRGRSRDLIFNQFSIDCCQNAFASGAPPRTPLGGLQPPSWRRLGHTCAPPFLTFLDPPLHVSRGKTASGKNILTKAPPHKPNHFSKTVYFENASYLWRVFSGREFPLLHYT